MSEFISTDEIFDVALTNCNRRKYITTASIKVIAKAQNQVNNHKININCNGEAIRNNFFSDLEAGLFNLDFLKNVESEDFRDALISTNLITGGGQKQRFFLKNAKNTINRPPKSNSIKPNGYAPGPTTSSCAATIADMAKSGKSLAAIHNYNSITQLIEEGKKLSDAAPVPGGSTGAPAFNSTFNKIEEEDLSLEDVNNVIRALFRTSQEHSKLIASNKSATDTSIKNINDKITDNCVRHDNEIDAIAAQYDKIEERVIDLETDVPMLRENFKKMQNILGFDSSDSDGDSSDDEDVALPIKLKDAIKEAVNEAVPEAAAVVEPAQPESPVDRFHHEVNAARNRAIETKNRGELRIAIGKDANDRYMSVNPDDNRKKDFNHRDIKALLGIEYTVTGAKTGPGQPTIWVRVHCDGHHSARDMADWVLQNRGDFAGEVGIEWACHQEDNILKRLVFLKRRQIISSFNFGKSARFFVRMNDGNNELYNSVMNAGPNEVKNARNEYIKSCTTLQIDAPKLFAELPDNVVNDNAAIAKIVAKTAYYIDGVVKDYTQAELDARRVAQVQNVEAMPGTRGLRWN